MFSTRSPTIAVANAYALSKYLLVNVVGSPIGSSFNTCANFFVAAMKFRREDFIV